MNKEIDWSKPIGILEHEGVVFTKRKKETAELVVDKGQEGKPPEKSVDLLRSLAKHILLERNWTEEEIGMVVKVENN